MKLGMIGLGRMGANMTRRLARGDDDAIALDANADVVVDGGNANYRDSARRADDFSVKLLALMRAGCGGDAVKR